jgi:hypothetical protein
VTLLQSFRCVRLVLWDEKQRRLVSFRDGDAASDDGRHSAKSLSSFHQEGRVASSGVAA